MKGHMEALHRDGDFNVKTWIKCGLRSYITRNCYYHSKSIHEELTTCAINVIIILYEYLVFIDNCCFQF